MTDPTFLTSLPGPPVCAGEAPGFLPPVQTHSLRTQQSISSQFPLCPSQRSLHCLPETEGTRKMQLDAGAPGSSQAPPQSHSPRPRANDKRNSQGGAFPRSAEQCLPKQNVDHCNHSWSGARQVC